MRRKIQRWAAAFAVVFLCAGAADMTAPMQVMAAEETKLITVETTQRCSIWSAPATAEENRVKYVDAGYQINIYPEVIESELGDGKTFYRTVRGAYVLCKCVNGGNENGVGNTNEAGTANGAAPAGENRIPWWVSTADTGMPSPPPLDVVSAYSARSDAISMSGSGNKAGGYMINEYDEFGNMIKRTEYLSADGSLTGYYTWEYDASGREIKAADWKADGTLESLTYMEDFNEFGKPRKYTKYNGDGTVWHWVYYEEWSETKKKYLRDTMYYPDGYYIVGEDGKSPTYYDPDGNPMTLMLWSWGRAGGPPWETK